MPETPGLEQTTLAGSCSISPPELLQWVLTDEADNQMQRAAERLRKSVSKAISAIQTLAYKLDTNSRLDNYVFNSGKQLNQMLLFRCRFWSDSL